MKAWVIVLLLSFYDGRVGYPTQERIDQAVRLPASADCAAIRQAISQDLNQFEAGVSIYVECQAVGGQPAKEEDL